MKGSLHIYCRGLFTCPDVAVPSRWRGQPRPGRLALHKVFTIFISERGEEEEESSGGGVVERVLTGEGGEGN